MNTSISKPAVWAALGLSAALALAGCGKTTDNTTTTAPMSPSTSPSTTAPAMGSAGVTTTPGAMPPASAASK